MAAAPEYQPISPVRHGALRWQRYATYNFTARQVLLPLFGTELPQAAVAMPIAFVPQGDSFVPVAVAGVEPGTNLFVSLRGDWIARYIPAFVRSYPFALLPTADGKQVLCVDESSGLVSEGLQAEPFFEADGKLAASVQQALDFLASLEGSRAATLRACAALKSHGLIQPWEATFGTPQGMRAIHGLFCVDEAKLASLEDAAYLELRHAGALLLSFTQLLSMQHLASLGDLAVQREAELQKRAAAAAPPLATPKGDLDLSFMEGDTLRFS